MLANRLIRSLLETQMKFFLKKVEHRKVTKHHFYAEKITKNIISFQNILFHLVTFNADKR